MKMVRCSFGHNEKVIFCGCQCCCFFRVHIRRTWLSLVRPQEEIQYILLLTSQSSLLLCSVDLWLFISGVDSISNRLQPYCCTQCISYEKYTVHKNQSCVKDILKGTVSPDFLLLVFFMNQFLPSPRVFHLDRFEFFWKFADIFASQGAPPVSTTPVANLPPVSTTPVANCHRYQRHRRQICHRCQWHRWQIM